MPRDDGVCAGHIPDEPGEPRSLLRPFNDLVGGSLAEARRFVAFLLVGVTSAVITLIVRYVLNLVIPFEAAVALSHAVGVCIAFPLNKVFIFAQSKGHSQGQFFRFLLINFISLALSTLTSSFFYRVFLPILGVHFHPDVIANILGLACAAVPSYVGHKHFSFG